MAAISVRDVAASAGVSVGTVSNVLNRPDKVSPSTVERVQAAISQLGFVRNDAARQLRAGRSRSIGLVVLDVANPFFTDVARGAEDRAAEDGLTVLLGNSDENPGRQSAYLDLFEEQRVHGVLISPLGDVGDRLSRLRARGTPTVLVDREIADRSFSSVAVDDVAGGYLAVSHLAAIGRTRIAFVGGPHSIRQVVDRLEGARKAVAEHPGVVLETIDTESLSVLQGRSVGEKLLARPAGERPDAVFAANDLLAMGVLQALNMLGDVRVPRDIALIGYDDIAFASAAVVPLSSIRQPSALIGYTAVDLLLREAEGGEDFEHEQIQFQPELIVRASTAG
ncbi:MULTISPECIES: LacI family DNA-binding transcriptional regulator [unclassified Cryobacterium]|uniref:LacI family DNA-binding transcriptional regulator n=1 Tax=unclassified Cryobacterium TaxID=2649013 RepID=UPI002AB40B63|nr:MULTISPECIES: LacI family DNA-binding transcriptional regulator [unclassified Cryobacterium]MDY7542106.1 LacI family DNA-binding transcriptional regulator [Cryobacterium sp. 5B3]MEB0267498.1 LacI family DNA-binding transcriptional regulator [Cryobacterium sp. 10I5]MEB0276424.1 LacI family DNA-binding transcriptional regulator [Cryobacterium sp. 5B3]